MRPIPALAKSVLLVPGMQEAALQAVRGVALLACDFVEKVSKKPPEVLTEAVCELHDALLVR